MGSTALCNSKSDNWCKVIQLLLEDIRSRGSQQNAAGEGAVAAVGQGRTEEAQAEAVGPAPKLLLHGCEMPRLLQNHNGFLSRPGSTTTPSSSRRCSSSTPASPMSSPPS